MPTTRCRLSGIPHTLLLAACAAAMLAAPAAADTYPPDWQDGTGTAIHYQPVAWPAADGDGSLDLGDWVPYSMIGADIEDNKVQDPSNGGTSPQNYVNISSGCTDLTLPSVMVYFDDANQVLMFRWRVEQIAHTYAVGPNTQPAAAVDPWKSAQWTVLIDTDSDGYREYAVLVDGSSGTPGEDVDRMFAIYSDTPSQSIDYVNDPDVHLLAHNPTAFTDGPMPLDNGTGNILNFQNSLSPTSVWANGNGETNWDYGTSRARLLDQGSCIEYFVDYQIPLAALDATAYGGEQITTDTPMCLLFSTANSLNNPLQKDVVLNCDPDAGCSYCSDPEDPAPFGDCFTLGDFGGGDLGTIEPPIVTEVSASGCTPTLTAQVSDAVEPVACGSPLDSSIASVDFYYYYDANSNGIADDGNSWTFATAAAEIDVGVWRAAAGSWDTTILSTGLYLIGVRAEDDQGNVTWSHLTQAEVDAMFAGDFANPSPDPGVIAANFINSCGTAPSVTKSASVSEIAVGGTVEFTITVNADAVNPLSVSQIDDFLPSGWTYGATTGGTLSPSTSPSAGDSGTITWTFAPAAVIPAGGSGTLIFEATAPAVQGTYSNNATASTSQGGLDSNPVEVAVGAPVLTIAKDADVVTANPGDSIVYTITYSNDSPVSVTNTVITDVVPTGLTFVSATDGGTYDSGSRTVTWDVGFLGAGDGPYSVSFTVTVDSPYPSGAATPVVNTATIDSDETSPASDDASVFIALPLRVQKSASSPVVAAGANVTYTIEYANTGSVAANNPVLTDPVPAGFTFVSATGGGTFAGGVVTWSPPNGVNPLPPATSGTVTVTLQATSPYTGSIPSTNTVTFSADGLSPVTDDYTVTVTGGATCAAPTTYYMRRITGDVGFDGTQELANDTAPTNPTAMVSPTQTVGPGIANIQEVARFYEDPARTDSFSFSTDVTATLYVDKSGSPQAVFRLELFDYDPVTGATVSLGFNDQNVTGNKTNEPLAFTITQPTQVVTGGHRLLWVLSAYNNHGGQTNDVALRYDGTASASTSDVCVDLVQTILNKQVNPLSVTPTPAPLQTLTYTLQFANASGATVTGASITDVLPAGVTYSAGTAQLNGAPTGDPAISGQTLTFASVNGAGDPAGQISGGNSGTLTFQVTVDYPPAATSSTLVNSATLATAEADDATDSATTNVLRPNVVVTKDASSTLLVPGDTVTYTLVIVNAGTATAANPSLSDTLPVQPYFNYVSCTEDLTNAPSSTTTSPCAFASPTFTYGADLLAPGEWITLTFDMVVETVPAPPAGLTTHDNFATVTNTTDPATATSNTVTVTISTNPNLVLAKSSNPAAGPLAAGDAVTYTITIENTGDATALDVVVYDPVPSLTSYVLGSLTYDAASQTDADDGDAGAFNALSTRVEWNVGAMAPGAAHTMTFQVVLDTILPNGTSAIDNTAFATSSNTADKQASADLTAEAAPVFTFTKSAPATLARPLTTLAATVTGVTTFDVADATLLAINDYVEVNGTDTQITAISGNTLTVSTAISGTAGDAVNPVIAYVIRYRNTGTATATNVTISDPLPSGTVFVAADSGGTHDGGSPGTVTWSLGSIAPDIGDTVRFWARPTAVGSFTNTATLASDELPDQTADATTDVGVLEPSKSTSTPSVVNDGTGTTADYTLTVTNNSGATATNVTLTDTMESGFSYQAGSTSWSGLPPSRRTSTVDPTGGDNPATWCCWTLDPGDTLTLSFTADIAGNVGSGTYQNDVAATSDNVSALDFDFLNTTDEDVTVSSIGPNHVVITRFEAALGDAGVEILWETAAEVQAGAFRLLRLVPGAGYVRVHDGLLPALMSPQGGVYRVVDADAPAAGPLVYVLNEQQADGRAWSYGPFVVDPLNGAVLTPPAPRQLLSPTFAAAPRQRGAEKAQGGNGNGGGSGGGAQPGDGLRLGVAAAGLYRVGADDVDAALGLDPGTASALIRSGQLMLEVDGVEVPWMPENEGRATGLLFYGEGIDSRYTGERVYRLSERRGEEMGNASGAARGTPTAQATFRDVVVAERDLRPVLMGPLPDGADFWFWQLFLAGDPTIGRGSFVVETPRAVAAAGASAEITAHLQGVSVTGQGAHRVELLVNGVTVGEGSLRSFEAAALTFAFPASLLVDGGNVVELVAHTDPDVPMSIVALDRFEIAYERDYVATSPALAFAAEDHEQLVVDGFADSGILLLDVSDPARPRQIRGARVEPGTHGAYQVRFSPPTPGGHYLATVAAGLRKPSSIAVDRPSSLRDPSNYADYVVITRAALWSAAERLAAHREGQGLAAMVVDLDDVMDEFNGGQLDPEAIRAFLRHAAATWQHPPRYVALAGEGTFDYKDVQGLGDNLLPPLIVSAGWGLFGSDNRLGDLAGDDGVPEVAIGRIPASTPAELDAYVDKLIAYETAGDEAWMGEALLAADDPDATGEYTLESEVLAGLLPAGTTVHRAYLGEVGAAAARAELLSRWQSGVALVSWVGHAGLSVVAHEGVLASGDVAALTNGERAPVVSALACHLGNFIVPGFPSLAEELVLHGEGGAAAVWTAAGLSYNPRRVVMGRAFFQALSREGVILLGDAVLRALEAAGGDPLGGGREVLESQILLGDPALRLRWKP